jgi:hypothetical protein
MQHFYAEEKENLERYFISRDIVRAVAAQRRTEGKTAEAALCTKWLAKDTTSIVRQSSTQLLTEARTEMSFYSCFTTRYIHASPL